MNSLMSFVFLGALLASGYFLIRLIIATVRKQPTDSFKKKLIASVLAAVVALVGFNVTRSPEQIAAHKEKVEAEHKAAEEKKLADEKAAEEKRIADEKAAEEKRIADAKAAEQKAQEEARKKAEREAAEERRRQEQAEREARRLTIDEFETHLLTTLGVDSMSEPSRRTSGQDEILTYPLDTSGELAMDEVTTNGKIKRVDIKVLNVNRGSLAAAIVFYNVTVQAFTSEVDPVFKALGLDETIVDTITEQRKTTVNGYRFEKKFVGKTLHLSVAEI